jgi:hypothetical protein
MIKQENLYHDGPSQDLLDRYWRLASSPAARTNVHPLTYVLHAQKPRPNFLRTFLLLAA